jgi:hypothetical protein
MYLYTTHSQHAKQRRKCACINTAFDYTKLVAIFATLLILFLLTMNQSFADDLFSLNTDRAVSFHASNNNGKDRVSLSDSLSEDLYFRAPVSDRAYFDRDKDLPFNYLWMRQYQDDYRYRKGTSATGKVFRRTLRNLYLSYSKKPGSYSSKKTYSGDMESFFTRDLDYRLRVSTSKVRFKVEYEF